MKISSLLISAIIVLAHLHASPAVSQEKTWNAKKILRERDVTTADPKKPKYCQGGAFKPCICAKDVTKAVQYRPSVRECGRNAAIILSKHMMSTFSSVVRDKENRDRWPAQGLNGCTAYERDVLALNKCSAFKVQKIVEVGNDFGDAEIHCLGASGYSTLFHNVSRITIKLRDDPTSNQDPLVRLCLVGPDKPLN